MVWGPTPWTASRCSVHQKPRELVAVSVEPEQDAQPHVVDAAVHRPVHRLGVVVVVVLGARGVQLEVALLVVGLLEEDVGADARVLQLAEVLHRGGGDVDVDAPDVAVFVVDAVDGPDAVQDVLDGVVDRVLARFDGQPFVPHVLQRDDLAPDLLLRQLLARDGLVRRVVGAVEAAVDAVVGEVERREDHDAVPVERQLDLLRDLVHPRHLVRQLAGQEHGGLPVGEAAALTASRGPARARLLQELVDQADVLLVAVRVVQRF